jgi:RNA polymerase sigma-70 factor (ECF subfamily)
VSAAVAVPFILARVSWPSDRDAQMERERRLVDRARSGDMAAIGELLARHGPSLYRTVLLPRLGSAAAAEDALGEVYARVLKRFDRFTWQDVGVLPWLRVVALRVALDQLRARKRLVLWTEQDIERQIDAAHTMTSVDQELCERRDREEARARIEDALGRIHPRYARAIRLRVLEGNAREDVARELGVSPATFDVVLHRAMQAMRKALGLRGEQPPAKEDSDA